jgi:hypothetical protein
MMPQSWVPPTDFEGWIKHVFDHPISEPQWFRALTAEASWEPSKDKFLAYISRAFEQPATAFGRFSDAQLNQGLHYLISPDCSDGMFAVKEKKIPWSERHQAIQAILPLFKDCFARRCSPSLLHLEEKPCNPLNAVCYMWWDVFPVYGQPDKPAQAELDQAILGVIRQTLKIDHVACQEAALHGCGHWKQYYSEQVQKIIDEFLARNTTLRPELKQYALQARTGMVQ